MAPDPTAGSILVVDEDRVNRTLLAGSLLASGHEVRTAENGREALELLRAAPADVHTCSCIESTVIPQDRTSQRRRAAHDRDRTVALTVANFDAALRFYRDALGLQHCDLRTGL